MEALKYFLRVTRSPIGEVLCALLEQRILTPLNGKVREFPEGTIFVPCSDGHRFEDMHTHHKNCFNGSPMQMPLALPGGAILIAGDDRIEDAYPHMKQNMLNLIGLSVQAKTCPTVVTYTHVPCALARVYSMDIRQVLLLHARAHLSIQRHISSIGHRCGTVLSCFHIDFAKLDGDHPDYPEHLRFRTYEYHPSLLQLA